MRETRYDVVAKPENAVNVGTPQASQAVTPQGGVAWTPLDRSNPATQKIRLMMQALLEERFRLSVHQETREQTIYALVVGKNGPKLQAAKPDEKPAMQFGGMGHAAFQAQEVRTLATALGTLTGRTVEDRTGLTGKYDFSLEFRPEAGQMPVPNGGRDSQPAVADDNTSPSLFTALEEQLGLRLESAKGSTEYVVIDHAEKPSAN
jgi:uncharacterized protein (TIGR03435 family)